MFESIGKVEPIVVLSRLNLLTIHTRCSKTAVEASGSARATSGVFHLTVDSASHRPTVRRVYAAPRDLPTNWINTIVQSADGAVWVGSNSGLFHFLPDPDGNAYRISVYSTTEKSDEVWAIAEDRQQNLWLGRRHGGVGKLWHRGLTMFGAPDGSPLANSINATRNGDVIAVGVDANRWCLCRFDGMKFVANRFSGVDVSPGWGWSQMVLHDRTGDWWIATDHGLYRFTNLKTLDDVTRSSPSAIYTTRDGLAAPQVFRLFEDSSGDVWIGTVGGARAGLSRWQRRTGTLRHYTDGDGLPALDQCYVASFAEDRADTCGSASAGSADWGRYQDRALRALRPTADGVPAGRYLEPAARFEGAHLGGGRSVGLLPDRRARRRTVPRLSRYTTAQGLSSNTAAAPWLKIPGGASTSRPGPRHRPH